MSEHAGDTRLFGTLTQQFLDTILAPTTADTYRWALASFERFVAETGYGGCEDDASAIAVFPATSLDDDMLEEFYYWLNEQKKSQQTVRTYLSALRRFIRWLDARDLLGFQVAKAEDRLRVARGGKSRIPYKHRRVDPELPRVVTFYDQLPIPTGDEGAKRTQRLKILRARAIVHTLYASGGRVSEVASLTRELVLDGRLDEVHVTGKGGQTRVILLTKDAMQAIQAYLKERDDAYPGLFISHGRGIGQPLGRGTIWAVVKSAAKALGLHHSTSPHSFRHFRATQLLNEGMPLESVQAYLGHQDISTTRRIYAHTKTAVLRDQLATFGRSAAESLEDLEARRRTDRDRDRR